MLSGGALVQIVIDAKDLASAKLEAVTAEMSKLNTMGSYASAGLNKAFMATGASAAVSLGSIAAVGMMVKDWDMNLKRSIATEHLNEVQANRLAKATTDLSLVYGQQASTIAQGAQMMLKAGMDLDTVLSNIDSVIMASITNQTDLNETAELSVKIMTMFSDSVKDSRDAMNIMTVAAKESIMDFDDFSDALKHAGGSAKILGIDFEHFAAMVATLSQAGVDSNMKLNRLFMDLLNKAPQLEPIFKKLGVSVSVFGADGKANIDNVLKAFIELNEQMALTPQQWSEITDVMQTRALQAFVGMIGAGGEYDRILNEILNRGDELKTQYDEISKTLSVQWGRLVAAFKKPFTDMATTGKLSEFIEKLMPSAERLGQFLKDFAMDALKPEKIENYIAIIKGLMSVLSGLQPLIMTLSNLFTGMGGTVFKLGMTYMVLNKVFKINMIFSKLSLIIGKALTAQNELETLALERKEIANNIDTLTTEKNNDEKLLSVYLGEMKKKGLDMESIGYAKLAASKRADITLTEGELAYNEALINENAAVTDSVMMESAAYDKLKFSMIGIAGLGIGLGAYGAYRAYTNGNPWAAASSAFGGALITGASAALFSSGLTAAPVALPAMAIGAVLLGAGYLFGGSETKYEPTYSSSTTGESTTLSGSGQQQSNQQSTVIDNRRIALYAPTDSMIRRVLDPRPL